MDMLKALKTETNVAYTEKGAKVYKTTGSALVDFFAQGGALRDREPDQIIALFYDALNEDPLLAMKMLFYFRDVRGGQGERRMFRILLNWLAVRKPDYVLKNMNLVPFYGRWDDLYVLVGTPLENEMFAFLKKQFNEDLKSEHPSLLAKWLKSENTSSKESRNLARKTMKAFGLTPRLYRKRLAELRKKIDVVERKMSEGKWSEISYPTVPSRASLIYRNAFIRHDKERFEEFLWKVREGKEKINAGTLYPYDIVRIALHEVDRGVSEIETLDLLWNNLPDYIGDRNENSIAVVDTSGSMYPFAITVSVSLGLYLAERNKGLFHNHFITFSAKPELVEIKGDNIYEKIRFIEKAHWGMTTNLEAVFDLILSAAVKHGISQDEMVDRLYIISDMEFDSAIRMNLGEEDYFFDTMRRKFEDKGYKLPELVFWNVDARNRVFPEVVRDGVIYVSGCSPSILRIVLGRKYENPYKLVLEVLNSERYSLVKI